MDDGRWLQVVRAEPETIFAGWLALIAVDRPVVVHQIEVDGDDFVLRGDSRASEAHNIVLRRPDPTPDMLLPIENRALRLSPSEMIAHDPSDDAVTGLAERPLLARRHGSEESSVYLVGSPVSVVVGSTRVSVTRDPHGRLVIRQERMMSSGVAPARDADVEMYAD